MRAGLFVRRLWRRPRRSPPRPAHWRDKTPHRFRANSNGMGPPTPTHWELAAKRGRSGRIEQWPLAAFVVLSVVLVCSGPFWSHLVNAGPLGHGKVPSPKLIFNGSLKTHCCGGLKSQQNSGMVTPSLGSSIQPCQKAPHMVGADLSMRVDARGRRRQIPTT